MYVKNGLFKTFVLLRDNWQNINNKKETTYMLIKNSFRFRETYKKGRPLTTN